MAEILLYIVIITLACWGGYYIRSLSFSGSIASFVTGCCVAIGFGWEGLVVLGAFFSSSSYWSKYKHQQKGTLEEMLEKGSQRDWVQVLANGSIASFTSLSFYFTGDNIWMLAFLVSIAAANSDTWASEIGVLSKRKPIYILTLKSVEKGTSGAVSFLGTLSSFGAALFIAVVAYFLFSIHSITVVVLIAIFGFIGSVVDTLLGATVQAIFKCEKCSIVTEKTIHCEKDTVLIKGIKWCNNDVINWLSVFIATIGVIAYSNLL